MDLLESKIIAFGYIASRPHLTIQEKKNLLLFVKEASAKQLTYLLKEGRMYSQKEIILHERDVSIDPDDLPSSAIGKTKDMTAGERKQAADDALAAAKKRSVEKGLERAKARETTRQKEGDLTKPKAGEEGSEQPKDAGKNAPEPEKAKEPEAAQPEEKVKAGEEGAGGQPASKGQEPTVANRARDTAVSAKQKGEELAGKATEKGKELYSAASQKAQEVGTQAQQTGQQALQYAQQNPGQAAAIAAGGAAAITAGVLAYKRFFSKAARACSGMSGAQKTQCMGKYKVQAKKAEIATLNSKKGSCKGNPKCIAKIQARIQKAQAEAQSMAAGG
jgi:ElaB/YqjD/DUF883 family membrane-anchored ribosome-binding protein